MVVGYDMRKLAFLILLTAISIPALAHPSYGIVVDKYRNIYFTDITHKGRGSVWKLHNDGKLELLLEDFHAHNISIDAEGNIYTSHGEGTHEMVKISSGEKETIYETRDEQKYFGGNSIYNNGRLLFGISHYIWQIVEGKKSKLSDHYLEWNQSIYADEEGIVYATDKALNNGSIIRIDLNGNSSVIASDLITKLDRPVDKHNDVLLGITKGCDGFIYVAESAGKRVAKINKDGSNETFYAPKDGWSPVGLDFFSGDAYILEYNLDNNKGPRITKIKEDGSAEILFEYPGN